MTLKSAPQDAIRPATLMEKTVLEAIQMRASMVWETYRADLLAHPEVFAVPSGQLTDGRVLVAMRDDQITGFASVEYRADGDADLDGLFVEPAYWGQKIGTCLVENIRGLASARGCRTLHVVGNPHAEGFYTRCGFHQNGVVETQFGPGLAMTLPLDGRDHDRA